MISHPLATAGADIWFGRAPERQPGWIVPTITDIIDSSASLVNTGLWANAVKIVLITGEDGVYLTEPLLRKGYEIHGTERGRPLLNTHCINRLYQGSYVGNTNVVARVAG